jgi:hypothetical protein
MPIKPLEKKTNRPAIKILFLITLVATGILLDKIFLKKSQNIPSILGQAQEFKVQKNSFVEDSIKTAEEIKGVVLGETTAVINKLASDTGSFISDTIYNNSIGKVVEQIDKLPKDQQEKIREQICK